MLRPSTDRSCLHGLSSVPTRPQAARSATEVRYGAKSTVPTVVTYAELAQSYQYQARCSLRRSKAERAAMPVLVMPRAPSRCHGPRRRLGADVQRSVHLVRRVGRPEVARVAGVVGMADERLGPHLEAAATWRHLGGQPASRCERTEGTPRECAQPGDAQRGEGRGDAWV